ncbi:MAG: hypothetical protein S0880_07340 [Actinomycetota bacterium]|nr:hypothetical protein [Actinomycetota bacterium]
MTTPGPWRARRLRGDDGYVGGAEALPFGFLVLLVGALFVANVWAMVDVRAAAATAAREAARTYVEADPTAGDTARVAGATTAAADVLDGLGRSEITPTVVVSNPDGFERCARVTVEVSLVAPRVVLPFGRGIASQRVSATHSALVDPWRSGLEGDGCAF